MKTIEKMYGDPKRVAEKARTADIRNVVLVGRTRVGKSTCFEIIKDPRKVPRNKTIFSVTEDTIFDSLVIEDVRQRNDGTSTNETGQNKLLVLNIIDTPGLFEIKAAGKPERNNEAILNIIAKCLNKELTKFHIICFCVPFETSVNHQDIDAITLFMEFAGAGISSNCCLLFTQAESETQQARDQRVAELKVAPQFNKILPFFKKGVYFTGALNPNDWNYANAIALGRQFKEICKYRHALIKLFRSSIEPFDISHLNFSDIQKLIGERTALQNEKDQLTTNGQQNEQDIENLRKELESKICTIM